MPMHYCKSFARSHTRILLTLRSSLQVFENESHASVHSDKTKEGLSLFGAFHLIFLRSLVLTRIHPGTLNSTKTTLGRALLRTWLLRPSLSLPVIKARHDAVACFVASENLVPSYTMNGHLKGIKNVPRILEIMRSGKAKMSDWQGLVKVCRAVWLVAHAQHPSIVHVPFCHASRQSHGIAPSFRRRDCEKGEVAPV